MNNFSACARQYSKLVAAIYESVEADDAWSKPLEAIRTFMDANVGCLRITEKGALPKQCLFAAGPRADIEALEEWERLQPCELLPASLHLGEAMVVDWRDKAPGANMQAALNRYDIASTLAGCIRDDEGSQVTLNCSRGFAQPGFTARDLEVFVDLGRHFQKAMELRRQLTQSRIVSEFQTQALDSLGIAAILVGRSRSLTLLNETARFAIERGIGLKLTSKGLGTQVPEDDAALQKALKRALSAEAPGQAQAMSIHRDESYRRVHLVVRSQTHPSPVSGREETSALLFLRVNEVVEDIDVKLLQQQFSFTATEANVAIGLAQGMCLKDVEQHLKIRHNTARAHLRSMFSKADVARQSQLVSLLTSSLVPLGRDRHRLLQ